MKNKGAVQKIMERYRVFMPGNIVEESSFDERERIAAKPTNTAECETSACLHLFFCVCVQCSALCSFSLLV